MSIVSIGDCEYMYMSVCVCVCVYIYYWRALNANLGISSNS